MLGPARMISTRATVAFAAVIVAMALGAAPAAAIERNCPRGQTWDPQQGACVKKKVVKRLSPEETYYKAIDHLEGKARGADPARAAALLAEACTQRHAASCNLLGFLYQNGRGVAYDPKQALARFTEACDLGEIEGCVGAAEVHS